MPSEPNVTRLLAEMRAGNSAALNALFPLVYSDLRGLARRQLRGAHGTLHTTAVVHEAYLRFAENEGVTPNDRRHFFALAARAMRQIVIDHARRRLAQKRGGGAAHTILDDAHLAIDGRAGELLDLHAALERMENLDVRLGRVVELRFFAGLSVEESAEALGRGAEGRPLLESAVGTLRRSRGPEDPITKRAERALARASQASAMAAPGLGRDR